MNQQIFVVTDVLLPSSDYLQVESKKVLLKTSLVVIDGCFPGDRRIFLKLEKHQQRSFTDF